MHVGTIMHVGTTSGLRGHHTHARPWAPHHASGHYIMHVGTTPCTWAPHHALGHYTMHLGTTLCTWAPSTMHVGITPCTWASHHAIDYWRQKAANYPTHIFTHIPSDVLCRIILSPLFFIPSHKLIRSRATHTMIVIQGVALAT